MGKNWKSILVDDQLWADVKIDAIKNGQITREWITESFQEKLERSKDSQIATAK